MAPRLNSVHHSEEVRSYEGIRPKAAQAHLKSSDAVGSNRTDTEFRHGPKIWDAIVRGHGSVNAAAITIDNTDPTQLKREIESGNIRLKKFFQADESALCEFAEYVLDTFQPARKTPAELAMERLPELLACILAVCNQKAPR